MSKEKKEKADKIRKEVEVEKKSQADNQSSSEQLSFYTGASMIQVLVSAATAIIAMLIWAKPVFYILDTIFSKQYGEYNEMFQMDNVEVAEIIYFEGTSTEKIVEILVLIGALLLVVGALSQLVIVVRAVNPKMKPWLACNIIGIVTAVAGVCLYAVACFEVMVFIDSNLVLAEMTKEPYFNLYVGCYIAMAVNIIGAVVNTFASVSGLKKWKKNGVTY